MPRVAGEMEASEIDELEFSDSQSREIERGTPMSKGDIANLISQNCERISFFSSKSKSDKSYKDWNCYRKIKLDQKIVNFVQCISCKKVLSYTTNNGNSNLRKHKLICDKRSCSGDMSNSTNNIDAKGTDITITNSIEKSTPKEVDNSSSSNGLSTTNKSRIDITRFMKKVVAPRFKQEVNDNIVLGLAKDIRPLSSVESPGFLLIAQSLIDFGAKFGNQRVKDVILNRTTLKRKNLPRLFQNEMDNIKTILKNNSTFPKFAFTFDMWTEKYRQRKFLSLSIHFINDNWELVKYTLGVSEFVHETACTANIRATCINILQSYFNEGDIGNIFDSSFSVTDGGSNMINVFEKRFDCECHKVNNCMEWMFLDKLNEEIVEMHAKGKLVHKKKLFRLSEKCPNIKLSINAIKALVSYFKRTGLNAELPMTLKQDVPTRFNSEFIMLKSYLESAEDVKRVLLRKNELTKIAAIDEVLINELVQFLEPFSTCTDDLSGDKYPTIQRVALNYHKLKQHIIITESDSFEIRALKHQSKICFDEYCKVKDIHYVACMLDPRCIKKYIYFIRLLTIIFFTL